MRIAATYENGEIFQHFGHTEKFKLYDVSDGKLAAEQVVSTNGRGHGALAGFLKTGDVRSLPVRVELAAPAFKVPAFAPPSDGAAR